MERERPSVLVVDRETAETRALLAFLRRSDLEVVWARDGESGLNALERGSIRLLVSELRSRRIDGLALLQRARALDPETCAVLLAGGGDLEIAVEALRLGASDFQLRPIHLEKLVEVLRRGLAHQGLAARAVAMERRLDERFGLEGLTGRSRAIQRVRDQVRSIAAARGTVLIEGEPGTGKSLVAQAIHQNGPRRHERFVTVDCGATAEELLETELFGDERGASSSASPGRGRLELADGGTLVLEEIGGAPATVQVKLLRFLHDRTFERVGAEQTLRSDVRMIVTTRRDLAAEVRSGRFREDLEYRLRVARIQLPPLRERREDIPLLVETFLRDSNREHRRRVTGMTRGALDLLVRHEWPGNVLELRNAVEGMAALAESRRPLDLSDLPPGLRALAGGAGGPRVVVGMTVAEAERELIVATLEAAGGDKPRAAAMLGIGLRTLYRKLEQYAIR